MKTQCPHCHTKFNAPDEHEGKKAKCPKCKQPFVIAPFQEAPTEQVCTSCRRKIGEADKIYVVDGQILCGACHRKLQTAAHDPPSQHVVKTTATNAQASPLGSQSPESPREINDRQSWRLSIAVILGIILAVFSARNLFREQREPMYFVWNSSLIITAFCIIVRSFRLHFTGVRLLNILLGVPLGIMSLVGFLWGLLMLIRGGSLSAFCGVAIATVSILVVSAIFVKLGFETGAPTKKRQAKKD